MSSSKVSSRKGYLAVGLAALIALAPAVAEARAGSGSSVGSRGSRTFSAPPSTNTAPRAAAPMERSAAPQTAPSQGFNRPSPAPAASGGLFGGMGRGFLGGLLGAGLLGMLFGGGLMGGLGGGGLMSILGLLLQFALVFFIARFAFRWWMSRQQPAMAGAGPDVSPRNIFGGAPDQQARNQQAPSGFGGFGGFGGGAAPQPVQTTPLTNLGEQDFNSFEKLLVEVQSAYGDESTDRLRRVATAEMVSYFSEEIADTARKGHVTRLSRTRLLQGDLSEAWREGNEDYATVAMRFSIVDVTKDRTSGAVVSGDPVNPIEVTEIWTFVRPAGAGPDAWTLSGIQQTS